MGVEPCKHKEDGNKDCRNLNSINQDLNHTLTEEKMMSEKDKDIGKGAAIPVFINNNDPEGGQNDLDFLRSSEGQVLKDPEKRVSVMVLKDIEEYF